MGSTKQNIPQTFKDLPVQARIELVQDLWDFIAASPEQIPLPDSHKQILDERRAAFEANPEPGKPWTEVREGILQKLRER